MILKDIIISNGIFYVLFAFIMAVAAFLIVPRKLHKKYFLYGLVFGGIADVIIANTATLIGLHRYQGFEPFGLFGIYSIWTPITWTFAFMVFFYFLPIRTAFSIPYILAWSALNYSVGLVMKNLGLFWSSRLDMYIAPIIFLVWYSIAAWVFRKYDQRLCT